MATTKPKLGDLIRLTTLLATGSAQKPRSVETEGIVTQVGPGKFYYYRGEAPFGFSDADNDLIKAVWLDGGHEYNAKWTEPNCEVIGKASTEELLVSDHPILRILGRVLTGSDSKLFVDFYEPK